MKHKVFGVGLGSSIFILLLIAVLALVRPVYLRVYEALSELEQQLSQKLEDETGLSLSYKSLSPSIFIGVNLRNISISEVATKNKLVTIKRAKLTYDVLQFFSKNPKVALKELSLNGVVVEFDAMKNTDFIEKIKKLVENQKVKKIEAEGIDAEKIEPPENTAAQEKEPDFDIPIDVFVKNLSVHYSDKQNDVLANLKKIKFKDFSFSEGIELSTSGKVFYKTGLYKTENRWTSVAANFSVSGKLFPNLEGSSALVSISGVGGADYSISNLDMLVNYSGDKFEVRTMRTVLPFSIFASYDMEEKSVAFSGDFERFNPFSLVSIRKKTPMMQKINGTTISGSLFGKIGAKEVSYDTNISLALTKKLLGESVNLSLRSSGDNEKIDIAKLAARGNFIDADFTGSFDFKKLQPSGLLSLNYFILKNGGMISSEVYVDPYRNGFTCVAPQIFMNEKSFTGVQFTALPGNNSVDFQFELLDFAHPDYEETGRLQIDGSFLTGREKFVQASVVVSNIFADSIVDTVAFFLPQENAGTLESISEKLRPYIFNTEAYFSSDFKDFSANAPVCLFANTEKDRELVSFAVDGSRETLQFSSFDLLFGNQSVHAEIGLEFADSLKEFSFTNNMTLNSVPYRFFGTFTPEWISVSGDYNFDAIVSIDEEIGATLQFSQLPVAAGKYVFALSTNSIVHWNKETGFEADILNFEIDEPSLNLHFNPHLALSGNLTKYGFVLNTLSYSDSTSTLDGSGTLVWNLNEGIFDSIHSSLNLKSPISSETISISADVTNPNQLPFSGENLRNEFYISLDASLKSFPSSRLLSLQNAENTVSADLTASGTLSNPFVSIQLHRSSLLLYGYPLYASGSFVLDDTGVHISGFDSSWSVLTLSNLNLSFDPAAFVGSASLTVDASVMEKSLHAPFNIKIDGSTPEKKFSLPDFYSISLSSDKITGDLIKSDFPFKLIATHIPGQFDVMTDVTDGFHATFTSDGKITAVAGKKSPIQVNLTGGIENNELNFDLTGIVADMRYICSEIEIPFVSFNSGILTGALRISGPTTDPEFTGAFSVAHPNFLIPLISKNYLHAEKVIMTVGQGEAVVPPTLVTLGKGLATVEYRMDFNRWIPNSLELKIDIDDDKKVPLDLTFPFIHAKGLASGNLNLLFTLPKDLTISGYVLADDTDVEVIATPLQNQLSIESLSNFMPSGTTNNPVDLNITVDFNIVVGQKVQLLFNPFLRGVVAPGTPLSIYLDTYSGDFAFNSDITLRGGEIIWLNRNFYMKEGRIVFNETQESIDPKVTVRAETRERDENGSMVTIILSANNQPVSSFNPVFSSNPAKSEREIMQLLGQIVTADSTGGMDILGASGDILVQSTVMRRVENTLRELLNFDIVSIRTNVLQNSLKLSMDEKANNKQLTVGNFIDNSTVYIGKYFGSSIYLDSMLHWSYDENKIDDEKSVNGIVFQPEIGFEMTSPFVNIRLGVAPDINSLQKGLLSTWVPSTSMTLSWKFAF